MFAYRNEPCDVTGKCLVQATPARGALLVLYQYHVWLAWEMYVKSNKTIVNPPPHVPTRAHTWRDFGNTCEN